MKFDSLGKKWRRKAILGSILSYELQITVGTAQAFWMLACFGLAIRMLASTLKDLPVLSWLTWAVNGITSPLVSGIFGGMILLILLRSGMVEGLNRGRAFYEIHVLKDGQANEVFRRSFWFNMVYGPFYAKRKSSVEVRVWYTKRNAIYAATAAIFFAMIGADFMVYFLLTGFTILSAVLVIHSLAYKWSLVFAAEEEGEKDG